MDKQINIVGLFKTKSAAEENGDRVIYIEASREDLDQEDEIVLCKALKESAEYFKTFGNLDIDHITQTKPPNIRNPYLFEIGKPVEVLATNDNVTMVKVRLYQGTGTSAEMANYVWSSLTQQEPPMTWYASVGGEITDTAERILPDGKKCNVITGVRWSNLALSKTPCLTTLHPASLTPIGAFAKSAVAKAMESFTETDSNAIEGYQSLIPQSLDGGMKEQVQDDDLHHQIAQAILDSTIDGTKESIINFIQSVCSCTTDQARELAEQFLLNLKAHIKGVPMKKSDSAIANLVKSIEETKEVSESEEIVEETEEAVEPVEESVEPVEETEETAEVSETEESVEVSETEETVEEPVEETEETEESVEKTEEIEETEDLVKEDVDKIDTVIGMLNSILESMTALSDKLASNDELVKSLDKSVKTLQKSGMGRRGVTAHAAPAKPVENLLTKCLNLQAEHKISAADTVVIDDSVKRGLGIPAKFAHLFN